MSGHAGAIATQEGPQMGQDTTRRVELWPQTIEMGDAVAGPVVATYLRLYDPEEGLEVTAFLNAEATRALLAFVRAGVLGQGDPH